MILQGGSVDDAIILQLKEAGESVLEAYLGQSEHINPAQRVVEGQRLMQASSDIFLGWHQDSRTDVHYYWRQLKDMKGSVDPSALDQNGFKTYVGVCAVCLARAQARAGNLTNNTYATICSLCLARAHARTGDEAAISGYIGRSDIFAKAIADFAAAYADQTERDFRVLEDKVNSGQIAAYFE